MRKWGRRELLGFGFCTLASRTVWAEGTQRLPPTTVRHRQFVNDPTRSSSSGAAQRAGFPSRPTPEASGDPTHNAPGEVDQTRLLLDSTIRNYDSFRKKSVADLRSMI